MRLSNKREYDRQKSEKHKKEMKEFATLPQGYDFNSVSDLNDDGVIEMRRDKRMAKRNPEKYCADRCVATGHCDVFEDMFEMGPEEVLKFCTECVLSEDEEPCDIPEVMFDTDYPDFSLRP